MLATEQCPKCGAGARNLEFFDREYNTHRNHAGINDVIYEYWHMSTGVALNAMLVVATLMS